MTGFIKSLRRGTKQEALEIRRVKHALAECCYREALNHPEVGNVCLYDALSHMVQVPELQINLTIYDHLQFNTSAVYDEGAAEYVRLKLAQLEEMLKEV